MRECDYIQAKGIFSETKAIITGDHFVYAKKPDGWYHGDAYVNKDAVYPFVDYTDRLCRMIAEHYLGNYMDVIVGPTVGAVILSQRITSHLVYLARFNGKSTKIFSVFADEVDGQRVIKRGYDAIVKGKRCLIVEDIINSGLTVTKTRDAILQAGGTVVSVAALCNRSGGKVTAQTLGVPELVSLISLDMKMHREEECPICKERGVESVRTDLGKGQEFLARIGKV